MLFLAKLPSPESGGGVVVVRSATCPYTTPSGTPRGPAYDDLDDAVGRFHPEDNKLAERYALQPQANKCDAGRHPRNWYRGSHRTARE